MNGNWAPGRDYSAVPPPPRLSLDDYLQGILAHDRVVLARAITLIESSLPDQQEMARELVTRVLPHAGRSIRIGLTGAPGVGKSALIEAFGSFLTAHGHRVAVLSIDPSSERSGGSLLGDKTRMVKLSTDPNAFIRPMPNGLVLGGIARQTRETMLVCEAAGYDIIVIETVGVGQSEVRVAEMTDFLLVLMLAGAGDELQGIKRGLLELADLIAIAKADGGNVIPAKLAASKYAYAMHLLADPEQGMAPVITCSALDGTGLEEIWKIISERTAERERSGYLHTRRNEQNINWMWSLVDQHIHDMLHQRPAVDSVARSAAAQVRVGVLSPIMAAETIISALFAEGVAAGTAGGVGHPLTAADGTVTLPCEERERSTPCSKQQLLPRCRGVSRQR
ncbi:MAG TPA: methylmalonyl Co-A mutase-associated GTPase MeaB [Acetobacteraceae bacterium]|nr:methylmalonyl Co-A mutase-associated GTPase MeaB [Acetobacteraceae bacterium]